MWKSKDRADNEKGQAIILFVLVFTVIVLIGAIVIDFGLWFSERRGAQKDADAAALAGAQAYVADLTDTSGSFADAVAWAEKNGIDPADIDVAPSSTCTDGNSCMQVGIGDCRKDGTDTAMPWVESRVRHNSRSLFASIFNLAAPDIGGYARACVGTPRTATDLSPFGIQMAIDPETLEPLSDCMVPDGAGGTEPVFGAVCIIKTGGGDCVSGQCGQLTLGSIDCDQTSSNTLRHDFHYGTLAGCSLGQEVNTGTGNIIGLLQGLNDRLEDEGTCDQGEFFKGNAGYDDFDEVFSIVGDNPNDPEILPSQDNVFAENACRITRNDGEHVHTFMPRSIDLVLIDQVEQGEQTATIVGFAGFYVIGCVNEDDAEAAKAAIELDLTHEGLGSFLNGTSVPTIKGRCEHPTGQDDILGIFVQTLAPPEDVGDPEDNLPLAIVLVE